MTRIFDDYRQLIDATLLKITERYEESNSIRLAMRYALNAGGKRIRPLLLLCMLSDLDGDFRVGVNAACAIEMIHTYSLIHDDLPAMDDDKLRRGQPTIHCKFDEATAILTGDALLTEAFNVAINPELSAEKNLAVLRQLSVKSGLRGMVLGQELDLAATGKLLTINELNIMHENKTGRLLALPLCSAAILAGRLEYIETMDKIGITIGRAFQIQDDLLDVSKTTEELGKDAHSDQKQGKCTFATIMPPEKARDLYKNLYANVFSLLDELPLIKDQTRQLITSLTDRQY